MSILSRLKMKCSISRNIEDYNSIKDKRANLEINWTVINEEAKCFISYYQLTDGKLEQTDVGLTKVNRYLGIYKSDENIEIGDKIDCDKFDFPFLVESANPVVNPIKNKVSHIEAILTVM